MDRNVTVSNDDMMHLDLPFDLLSLRSGGLSPVGNGSAGPPLSVRGGAEVRGCLQDRGTR